MSQFLTLVREIPKLVFKHKKWIIKKVEDYNIKEHMLLIKLKTLTFVVAYWEELWEQYRPKPTEEEVKKNREELEKDKYNSKNNTIILDKATMPN